MTKRVTTISGTVYEFHEGKVRRSGGGAKRGDGEWLKLLREPVIERFERMVIFTEPIAPDKDYTARHTTSVIAIEEAP